MESGGELERVRIRLVREAPLLAPYPVDSPETASMLISDLLKDSDREMFGVICLQTDLRPLSLSIVSVGTLDMSLAHPREVMKSAVLSNAASIILFHNHPSGCAEPSRADAELTDRMARAGEILGIPVYDHVIVGDGSTYYSFRENRSFSLPVVEYGSDPSRIAFAKTAGVAEPDRAEKLAEQMQYAFETVLQIADENVPEAPDDGMMLSEEKKLLEDRDNIVWAKEEFGSAISSLRKIIDRQRRAGRKLAKSDSPNDHELK